MEGKDPYGRLLRAIGRRPALVVTLLIVAAVLIVGAVILLIQQIV